MTTGYREFYPAPALARYVNRFWARFSGAGGEEMPYRILPDGCIDLILDITTGWTALVVGTMTTASVFEAEPDTLILGVRFRPGGALPFLNTAAHELTDQVLDVSDLGLRWLHPMALNHLAPEAAVRAFEQVLLRRLSEIEAPNPVVAHAVERLFAPGPPSVKALADDIGWSRQHLRRVLRHHVGVGPVTLARVARLQRAVELLQRPGVGLAGAAAGLGYFDQAHMHRDFRELAGVTPKDVVKSAGAIRPIRSLLNSQP